MIYLTSDLHGGLYTEGLNEYLSVCSDKDWLFILGDTELNFRDTEENRKFSAFFESLDCNIAFIDGNHENFDYLDSLPEEDWNGGKIHRVSDSIVHLMRGYVFNIDGKSFFTMGGCVSSQKWKDAGLWYPQENPSAEEIAHGYENLRLHNNQVDYILTHKHHIAPADSLTLEGMINYIESEITYKHWYFGHWHESDSVDEKHTVVFDKLIKL